MKFSWKIFISTIGISLAILSVGGSILLSALFQSTYQREVEHAIEENRMLQNSFAAYWSVTVQEAAVQEEQVRETALACVGGRKEDRIRMRIFDSNQKILYDNTQTEPNPELLTQAAADKRVHMLCRTEDSYSIRTISMICLEHEEALCLESIRDVTTVFTEREAQLRIYRWWMLGILVTEGVCSCLMAVWLLRPLRRLSRTTRRLAGGNLSVRARIESGDEIGELASDFNEMADSLERQFEELEAVNQRQEDFIGSFAHELKTPLTSIIGYADMLRTREMSQEEQFQAANYIFKEGKRLEALSFKLLELLVIQHQELERKPVNARWLAEDIQGMLKPSLQQAGITLKVIVENEQIRIEPDLMKTVLLNLLDNGRKSMEEGGTLYLLGRKEEEGFALYVRDKGKGIPKEELARITEAFYMVDKSRARRQGGAGLGLAICQEIVKRHEGTMTFKSVEGKGTIVRIWLPMEREERTK